MIAKTPDGKEIHRASKTYMPQAGKFCRGDEKGKGPYQKCGLLSDSSLPPGRTIAESFEIAFPYEEVKKWWRVVRNPLVNEINIEVELWYLPFGKREGNAAKWNQLWHKTTKAVTIQ